MKKHIDLKWDERPRGPRGEGAERRQEGASRGRGRPVESGGRRGWRRQRQGPSRVPCTIVRTGRQRVVLGGMG